MLSESARMSSTAELRFRLQAPNSLSRATTVIALDAQSEDFVRQLATRSWNNATFLTAACANPAAGVDTDDGWIWTLDGTRTGIAAEIRAADQVIMVAGPGGHAAATAAIGRECSRRRVTTTGLVIGTGGSSDLDISQTLAQLRPWSLMVVIANTDEYVGDMMAALRV